MDHATSMHESLAPIRQALSESVEESGRYHEAIESLRDVAQSARDASLPNLSRFAELLADLLVLADPGDEPLLDEHRQIHDFVGQALEALSAGLNQDPNADDWTQELTEQALDRWGDCLSVAGDHRGDTYAEETWVASNDEASDESAAPEVDASQIGLLLDSLTQLNEPTTIVPENSPSQAGDDQHPDTTPSSPNDDRDLQSSPVFGSSSPAMIQDEDLATHVPIDPDLREAYVDDAQQGLAAIEASLLAYENEPSDPRPLGQVCRELHTLKGASASVGLEKLARYLHHVEDELQAASENGGTVDLDPIFRAVDAVRTQIEGAKPEPDIESDSTDTASAAVERFVDSGSPGQDSVRVKSAQLDRLMDMLAELVMLRNRRESRVEQLKEVHNELVRCVSRLRAYEENHSTAALVRSGAPKPGGRPELHREQCVSSLTEIANDLLLMGSVLRELYEPVGDENRAISGFIRQFRQELIQLRRVPVGGLFRRLQRSARDAARIEGKQVRMQLVGEEVGLETSVQQQLYEPLLHIVRNAVSHGIESESQRVASGKQPTGTVTLEAHGGANLLVVTVRDDGRGLDYDALRRRGSQMGLIPADRAVSKAELARLIFHPGFSTRSETSEVSGRGVGMDVVAAALDRMHSWVEVDSLPGQGTSIRLLIPLHSVIEHVMVFRAGGQEFAVPTQFVRYAGKAEEAGEMKDLPSRHLSELFGVRAANATNPALIVLAHGNENPGALGSRSERNFGILVDEIVGPEEVVVRPVPNLLSAHRLFSGVTLSGVGDVMLIFDSQQLLAHALQEPADRDSQFGEVGSRGSSAAETASKRVLIVDDSRTSRRAIRRCLESFSLEADEAVDGLDALKRLKDGKYDFIFTDLEMPEMGGMDLLAEIRRDRRTADIPVVVVSSRAEDVFRTQARQLGANDYLVKPVNEALITNTMQQIAADSPERSSQ